MSLPSFDQITQGPRCFLTETSPRPQKTTFVSFVQHWVKNTKVHSPRLQADCPNPLQTELANWNNKCMVVFIQFPHRFRYAFHCLSASFVAVSCFSSVLGALLE